MQTIQLISLRHSAFYTPYLMTFMGGFLVEQGLKAEYQCVSNVEELERLLSTGKAHVAQSAVGISMRKRSLEPNTKNDIYHFAQINQRDGFFIAASLESSAVNFNWNHLENKRIIADHLFQPIATLKFVLNRKGVDIGKIEFIDIGDAQQSQLAFLSGEADYIHLQGPYPQQLAADGKAKIVASVGSAVGEIAYSSLCATSSWLESPMAKKFMLAYKKSLNYVQKTEAQYLAEQLSPQFDTINLETLTSTIDAYKKLESWTTQACISKSAFESANKVFLFSGDISSNIDYGCVVSNELCKAV